MKKFIVIFMVLSSSLCIYAQDKDARVEKGIKELNKCCQSSSNKTSLSILKGDIIQRNDEASDYQCKFKISDISSLKTHNSGFYKDLLIRTGSRKIDIKMKGEKSRGSITVISFAVEKDRDRALEILEELRGL